MGYIYLEDRGKYSGSVIQVLFAEYIQYVLSELMQPVVCTRPGIIFYGVEFYKPG